MASQRHLRTEISSLPGSSQQWAQSWAPCPVPSAPSVSSGGDCRACTTTRKVHIQAPPSQGPCRMVVSALKTGWKVDRPPLPLGRLPGWRILGFMHHRESGSEKEERRKMNRAKAGLRGIMLWQEVADHVQERSLPKRDHCQLSTQTPELVAPFPCTEQPPLPPTCTPNLACNTLH